MFQICPKCNYTRKADDAGPPDECPSCGLIYSKYMEITSKRDTQNLSRVHAKPEEKKSPLGLIFIVLGLFALVAFAWSTMQTKKEEIKEIKVPLLARVDDPLQKYEFKDLYANAVPFKNLATKGHYTIVEVYLDQCVYCRELEAALQSFQEKRPDVVLVRVHHPGTMNNQIQASSQQELDQKVKAANELMLSYQLCGSPHVEIYGPDRESMGADSCNKGAGTNFLWTWIQTETGIARHSKPGLVTRLF